MRVYATAGRSCADPDAVLSPRLNLQLLLLLLLLLLLYVLHVLHTPPLALLHVLAHHYLGACNDQRERSAHVTSHCSNCAHATPRSKHTHALTHARARARHARRISTTCIFIQESHTPRTHNLGTDHHSTSTS